MCIYGRKILCNRRKFYVIGGIGLGHGKKQHSKHPHSICIIFILYKAKTQIHFTIKAKDPLLDPACSQ